MNYVSDAWQAVLRPDLMNLPNAGGLIADAYAEAVRNRQLAQQAGDQQAETAMANRLAKLGLLQARWVGEADAGDIGALVADIEAHSALYDPLGKAASIVTGLAVIVVLGVLVAVYLKVRGRA